nr:substrate-binding domain-containing protein [Vibrio sinus]
MRVAMVGSLANHLSTPLVKLIRHHSESWTISTDISHLERESLIQRNVDIVISDDSSAHHEYLSRFPIVKEPFLIVLPKNYEGRDLTLEQISKELDLVRYDDDSFIGQTVENYIERCRIDAPTKVKLDNTQSVLSCVAAGLGWTITTPLCLLQSGIPREELTCLALPSGEQIFRELSLYSRQNELDNLPLCMSQNSQQIIRDKFMPKLERELPWLSDHVQIG